MKRIIAFFLVCFVLFSVASVAEGFSVRNGITFGMTEQEIIDIEGKNGNTEYEEPSSGLIKFNVDSIAGIEGGKYTSVEYSFEEQNNSLFDINYGFGNFSNLPEQYSSLLDAFVEKYGEPSITNIDQALKLSSVIEDYQFTMAIGGKIKVLDFHRWEKQYDEGPVIIDLFLWQGLVNGSYNLAAAYRLSGEETVSQDDI